MQPSSTKKRRLASVLQHYYDPQQPAAIQQPPPQQQQSAAGRSQSTYNSKRAGSTAGPASEAASNQQQAQQQAQQPDGSHFPYKPLDSSCITSHTALRLMLPPASSTAASAAAGAAAAAPADGVMAIEDALEALMVPHMPPHTARSMITSRITAEKAMILSNPSSGKVNLARPSAAARGRRQRLADKLMPRSQRVQLTALSASGINYAAMLALHDLWCKYAAGVLAGRSGDSLAAVLQSLDWHGALVRVTSSTNPIYTHRAGIIAKATTSTFVLVFEDGRSSIVPLKGSCFECSIHVGEAVHTVSITGDSARTLKCTQL